MTIRDDNAHVLAGRKGGRRRARSLSAKRRSEIARAAAAGRWSRLVPRTGILPMSRIRRAVEALVAVCSPVKVVLFGSYGRGRPRPGSDVDLLVIRPKARSWHELVSAQRELKKALDLPVHVDLLIADQDTWDEWKDEFGSVYYDAAHEGMTLHG